MIFLGIINEVHMKKKISTIFFDIDNTLLNHTGAEQKALLAIKAKYFPRINVSVFEKTWNEKTKKNWLLYEKKQLTFEEQRIRRIFDVWNAFDKTISEDSSKEIFEEFLLLYEKFWKLFPGTHSALKQLHKKGFSLGIITNGNKNQQMKKILQMGIYSFFKKKLIVISEEVGYAKPQKEIFLYSQVSANTRPENILFVGDNFMQDIEPATKLNWNTVLVNNFDSMLNKKNQDFRKLLQKVLR